MEIYISWIGVVYIFLLMCPNIIWTHHQPMGYDASGENKIFLFFERIGEVCTTCFAVISFYKPIYHMDAFFIASFLAMFLYEGYWIRYFKSSQTLQDFYTSFVGIPLAGATLPVFAFLCLGISLQNIFLIISVIILGIGHIGIHCQHLQELGKKQ